VSASIKLGSILGITIRVHVLLLVLAGIFVFRSERAEETAVLLGILFGIILLHELAHSVVAMRFGLRVVDITLWPLGGMARMTQMPESPRIEGLVAVAGPFLNFALAMITLPVWLWAKGSDSVSPFVADAIGYSLLDNLMLGGFNLLPAVPMDGGRILRAFLGRGGNWVRATEIAVTVGRGIAILLGLFGLLTIGFLGMQSVLFMLVALFVWWAGTQELLAVRARHGVDPLAAFRAFAAQATGWSQTQARTEPARPARGPVAGDPPPLRREPGQDPLTSSSHAPSGANGVTDEEIARLEQFRGPLRSFPEVRPEDG
jgi:Zn-dependent protease